MGSERGAGELGEMPTWPALTSETLDGVSRAAFGPAATDRAGIVRYEAAVPPMIAGRSPELVPEVNALAEEATRELSRFDAARGWRLQDSRLCCSGLKPPRRHRLRILLTAPKRSFRLSTVLDLGAMLS